MTPETIVGNMDAGVEAADLIEMFELRATLEEVLAIYEYAQAQLAHPA